jgi:glyoxylase-like metal-dependent hydrolase (beta-lactamase superfamily II)
MGLPAQVRVIERGWLNSNNIVLFEGGRATVIDSGYVTHAEETVSRVRQAVEGRRPWRLINTHSHSDHIGGNAALKRAFDCRVVIPNGMEEAVAQWDESALLLSSSEQRAERFEHDAVVAAGDELEIGGLSWRAIAAPGHDMAALVFYCPERRLLVSGDALWRTGFGLIFAALLGDPYGFEATRDTLERIGRLAVDWVIPGHGPPFAEFDDALAQALGRLRSFEQDGERLARHALRVMFTYALLEKRSMAQAEVPSYLARVPIIQQIRARYFDQTPEELAAWLLRDLIRAGAIRIAGGEVVALGQA